MRRERFDRTALASLDAILWAVALVSSRSPSGEDPRRPASPFRCCSASSSRSRSANPVAAASPPPRRSTVSRQRRATQIARSVVRIARAEEPERWPGDVGAALDMAKRVTSPIAVSCGGRIELDVAPEVRKRRVVMNPIEFEEAIVNLIRNGLESRPAGVCVQICARFEADEIVLRVEDDGPGIPVDAADHVFDRFFTTKADRGGSGLGLAIVKRTLEGIGGSIELARPSRPHPGRPGPRSADRSGGACFRIRIPTVRDAG